MEFAYFILRYFHFLAGITWIGILYYFNFIQTPFFGSDLGGLDRVQPGQRWTRAGARIRVGLTRPG